MNMVLLAFLSVTLALMHGLAAARVSEMKPLAELPLWYGRMNIPTLLVVGLSILSLPIILSGIVWSFHTLGWMMGSVVIVASLIVAALILEKMPPMLAVLLTGLPSFLLAIIIWFV